MSIIVFILYIGSYLLILQLAEAAGAKFKRYQMLLFMLLMLVFGMAAQLSAKYPLF